jgi:hypothetical protein
MARHGNRIKHIFKLDFTPKTIYFKRIYIKYQQRVLMLDVSSLEEDPAWEKLLSLSIQRADEILRVFERLGKPSA